MTPEHAAWLQAYATILASLKVSRRFDGLSVDALRDIAKRETDHAFGPALGV